MDLLEIVSFGGTLGNIFKLFNIEQYEKDATITTRKVFEDYVSFDSFLSAHSRPSKLMLVVLGTKASSTQIRKFLEEKEKSSPLHKNVHFVGLSDLKLHTPALIAEIEIIHKKLNDVLAEYNEDFEAPSDSDFIDTDEFTFANNVSSDRVEIAESSISDNNVPDETKTNLQDTQELLCIDAIAYYKQNKQKALANALLELQSIIKVEDWVKIIPYNPNNQDLDFRYAKVIKMSEDRKTLYVSLLNIPEPLFMISISGVFGLGYPLPDLEPISPIDNFSNKFYKEDWFTSCFSIEPSEEKSKIILQNPINVFTAAKMFQSLIESELPEETPDYLKYNLEKSLDEVFRILNVD